MLPNLDYNSTIQILDDLRTLKSTLEQFHPIFIEGPNQSDERDADTIARHIIKCIHEKIKQEQIVKPIMFICQGDQRIQDETNCRGIVSIIDMVSNQLNGTKCLICIDEHLYEGQVLNADRTNVIYEMRYSQMIQIIKECTDNRHLPIRIEEEIDHRICTLNQMRKEQDLSDMGDWCKSFALLQEMTKVALKVVCGDITVVHTLSRSRMDVYSVTGFYFVGLKLGIIDESDMIFYNDGTCNNNIL